MRKIFIIFVILLFFAFDCSREYEKNYESAYKYYSVKEIDSLKKADEEFSKVIYYAIKSMNGKYEANMALGLRYKDMDMFLEAVKVFEIARKIMPKAVKPYYEIGSAYANYLLIAKDSEKKKYSLKVEDNFNAGYQLDPNDIGLNRSMGLYYGFIKKDIKRGVFHLEKVIQRDGMDYGTYLSLGTLYFQRKEFSKAMDVYKKVIDSTPKESSFYMKAMNNIKKLQNSIR